MERDNKFKPGDWVRCNKDKDKTRAKVVRYDNDYSPGAILLDRRIGDFSWWNEDDLVAAESITDYLVEKSSRDILVVLRHEDLTDAQRVQILQEVLGAYCNLCGESASTCSCDRSTA